MKLLLRDSTIASVMASKNLQMKYAHCSLRGNLYSMTVRPMKILYSVEMDNSYEKDIHGKKAWQSISIVVMLFMGRKHGSLFLFHCLGINSNAMVMATCLSWSD